VSLSGPNPDPEPPDSWEPSAGVQNWRQIQALTALWVQAINREMRERHRAGGRQRLAAILRGIHLRTSETADELINVHVDLIKVESTALPPDLVAAVLALDALMGQIPARGAGRDGRTQSWERVTRRAAERARLQIILAARDALISSQSSTC